MNETTKDMVLRVLDEKDEWARHVAHSCQKCEVCTCGKHKCKFASKKRDLRPETSTYKEGITLLIKHTLKNRYVQLSK